MIWVEVLVVFLVCHLVGDFALQTEWQAQHKRDGLGGDPTARRALLAHVSTYTLAFVPAFVWLLAEDVSSRSWRRSPSSSSGPTWSRTTAACSTGTSAA